MGSFPLGGDALCGGGGELGLGFGAIGERRSGCGLGLLELLSLCIELLTDGVQRALHTDGVAVGHHRRGISRGELRGVGPIASDGADANANAETQGQRGQQDARVDKHTF
jgi:hypothetical protein